MLTLTENASTVVKTIAQQSAEQSESASAEEIGLRISTAEGDSQEFAVTTAEAPENGDEVVESEGARVFLSETASGSLSDKVLDAQVDDSGNVSFQLGEYSD